MLGRELFVQMQHAFDQGDPPVVAHDVGGGGEVDGADGEDSTQELIHRDPSLADDRVQCAPGNCPWMIGHGGAPMCYRVVPDLVATFGSAIKNEGMRVMRASDQTVDRRQSLFWFVSAVARRLR